MLAALAGAVAISVVSAVPAVPAAALAVEIGPAAAEGPAGLPDGRGYEIVSPPIKHGIEAGYAQSAEETDISPLYAVSSPNGRRVVYTTGGPAGSTTTAAESYALSERAGGNWQASGVLPPAVSTGNFSLITPAFFYPAAELDRFAFTAIGAFAGYPDVSHSPNLYVTRGTAEDPALGNSLEPEWLAEPQIANPQPALGQFRTVSSLAIDGASSNLQTVFFEYHGTLLPEDEGREEGAPGFYEWKDGVLHNAGELPDGEYSPTGARGAAHVGFSSPAPEYFNQVSTDGKRAFFTSVPSGGSPEQIYVRLNGERSVLVSRDELLQKEGEPPVPSPTAPVGSLLKTVIYASPDGDRVFFVDDSQLTANAPEGTGEKVYEFNVETETLTYLPNVAFGKGPAVIALSEDGSKLMYVDAVKKPWHINTWQETASGAQEISEVATVQRPIKPEFESARATADGSVFVFAAKAEVKPVAPSPAEATLNTSSRYVEVYRYAAANNELSCVSCPGSGAPTGEARLSNDDASGFKRPYMIERPVSSRGISADGSEVFFNTSQSLVKSDVNGQEDVYEWHEGTVSLISSGTSPQPSYLLDNSESGSDVFFATTAALVPEDIEGGYD